MVVVSDTSPISGLYRIGHLHLLQLLYRELVIPNAVFEELLQLQAFGYDLKEILAADWIAVKSPLPSIQLEKLRQELDAGEAEAIALSEELHADLLLIDEAKGRVFAKQTGVLVIGLLGVLIEAKTEGHIPMVQPLMDKLIREIKFRVSPALYKLVLEQAGE